MKKHIQLLAPVLLAAGSLFADPFGGKTAKADALEVELEQPARGSQPLVSAEPAAPSYCGEKELLIEETVLAEEPEEFIELKKPNRANQPLVLAEPELTVEEEENTLFAEEIIETTNCSSAENELHGEVEVEVEEIEFVELKRPNRANHPLLRPEPSFTPAWN